MDESSADKRTETSRQHVVNDEHDLQHHLITAIENGIHSDESIEYISEIIEFLTDYVRIYILSEELLMQIYNYPSFHRHTLQHDKIVEILEEISIENSNGNARKMTRLTSKLRSTIVRHNNIDNAMLFRYILSP